MSDEIAIRYLLYFLKFLDDETFKDLIGFIFSKKEFNIKPFNSYKEFFIYLLNPKAVKIYYKDEIDYEDLLNDKKTILELQEQSLLKEEEKEEELWNNSYYNLKCAYENIDKISKIYLYYDDDDIPDLLKFHDNFYIPTQNSDEIIYKHIGCIARSIDSFIGKINFDNTHFKKTLIHAVENIIETKYCYLVEKYSNNKYEIKKQIFMTMKDNEAMINTECYQILKNDNQFILTQELSRNKIPFNNFVELCNVINIRSYKELNRAIDKKINELHSEETYCHICNPYHISDEKKKGRKCENCKEIYRLINEIDDKQTTNSINGRIKRRIKEEKQLSYEEKKERHYKNLIEFVKKLEKNKLLKNVNTGLNTEKFNQLYYLIDSAFGKNNNK